MSEPWKLGTRGSALAVAQSGHVAETLEERTGRGVELVIVKTTGDRLSQEGQEILGKGVFTKELDEALLAGEVDFAVHSLKDVPTEAVSGITLAAVPRREDPRDALIWPAHAAAAEAGSTLIRSLPQGARVGTGSPRRIAQLLRLRPDLVTVPIRGNVDTRLAKIERGECEAVLLAVAGLARLGRTEVIQERIDVRFLVPAPAQGALGLLAREDDKATRKALQLLDDPYARVAAHAERAVLRILEGGCRAPFGAHAEIVEGRLTLRARAISSDGRECLDEEIEGPVEEVAELARHVADALLDRGAGRLFSDARTRGPAGGHDAPPGPGGSPPPFAPQSPPSEGSRR